MDALEQTASRPGSIRRWGLLVLLLTAGVGLAIALSRDQLPWQSTPAPPFVPDALEDYVPEDTVAVLRVDVDSLRTAPAGQRYLEPLLQAAVSEGRQRLGWINLLGAELPADLHWLQLSVGQSGLEQPLWLAGGKWAPGRLEVGPGKLQPEREQEFPLTTFIDPRSHQTTTLAMAGPTLVASVDRAQILTSLRQAVQPAPVQLRDATLAELWQQGKRRQTVWLAARLQPLQLASRVQGNRILKGLLPRLRQAGSVEGGLVCGEEVEAELHFRAADEDGAARLEREIQDACLAAPVLRWLKMDRRLLPLVDLLAAGKTSRQGTVVTLHSRLPAE